MESSRVREPRRNPGTQEPRNPGQNCSVTWLAVSGFMVMRLVFRFSLANHYDSESFLVVHALLSQEGCQKGFWEVVGYIVIPFDLFQTVQLVVSY